MTNSDLSTKDNLELDDDSIDTINKTITNYPFRIDDFFKEHLSTQAIEPLSGEQFLKKIMNERKSSLTGTYNNVSENEGFYLGHDK